VIPRAMILAAGLGLRMRPLTDRLPKPLLPVAGRSLLDRALDRLEAASVEQVVVNSHHLAGEMARYLALRLTPPITLLRETPLLDTGGGVANALPLLRPGPFYVVNGDALWLDGARDTLLGLAQSWDDSRMDALLLLTRSDQAIGHDGPGDFHLGPDGRPRRRGATAEAPYLFTGLQLLSERLFEGTKVEPFSLNRLYDKALAAGRLFARLHDGRYFHVGTPQALALAERALSAAGGPARGAEG
jgi:N-acetyl-alpha-D-muramate 1-phosphate uridylyltransferase